MARLYRYDDGYEIVVEGEESHRGLTADEATGRLKALRVDSRSMLELFDSADEMWKDGMTDRVRAVGSAWERARDGIMTAPDLDLIRGEMADPDYPYRRTYLINALYMGGAREEAIAAVVELLATRPLAEDIQLSLEFLAAWAPERYTDLAMPFVLGNAGAAWDIQDWAITYAGTVLRTTSSALLVEALIRLSRKRTPGSSVRFLALRALAEAAGFLRTKEELIHFTERGLRIRELYATARARRGGEQGT